VEEEGQKEGNRECSIHCKNKVSLMLFLMSIIRWREKSPNDMLDVMPTPIRNSFQRRQGCRGKGRERG